MTLLSSDSVVHYIIYDTPHLTQIVLIFWLGCTIRTIKAYRPVVDVFPEERFQFKSCPSHGLLAACREPSPTGV
jgi:hypothetical protein